MRSMTNPISKHQRIMKSNRSHVYGWMVKDVPEKARAAFEHVPYCYLNKKKEGSRDGESRTTETGTFQAAGR